VAKKPKPKPPRTAAGAGEYDPAEGGKFEPTTKAKPYGGIAKPGDPHAGHGHKGKT
jgi:hypothetical protein